MLQELIDLVGELESRARLARRLRAEGEHSVEEICEMLGVRGLPYTGTSIRGRKKKRRGWSGRTRPPVTAQRE